MPRGRLPNGNTARVESGVAYVDVSTVRFPSTEALVDEADLPSMLDGRGHWYAAESHGNIYVRRNRPGSTESLHRLLLRAQLVDHRNGNGLDNRRENLRAATPGQNSRNRVSHRGSSSRYRGVSFDASRKKWLAQIWHEGQNHRLGAFVDERAAALAYDTAALQFHGQFARPNFQEDPHVHV